MSTIKHMYVRCAADGEGTCYVFEVETTQGTRRVYPPGCGKRDEAASTDSDVLQAWFEKLRITRVVSRFGETKTSPECIADGSYTVAEYIKWWKQAEEPT